MLLRLLDTATVKTHFVNVADVRELYATGTVGQSNWGVTVSLGSAGSVNLASSLAQADAEALAREIAVALGIDWEG